MMRPGAKYEHRTAPLLSERAFRRRIAQHGTYAFAVLSFSLLIGTVGFHLLAHQSLIDALLNSAMLLGGMGPVGAIESTAGKLFAAVFALYAGLVFLAAGSLVLAPFLHRFLHRFHLEEEKRRESRRAD